MYGQFIFGRVCNDNQVVHVARSRLKDHGVLSTDREEEKLEVELTLELSFGDYY